MSESIRPSSLGPISEGLRAAQDIAEASPSLASSPMTFAPGMLAGITGTYALLSATGMDTEVRVAAFAGTVLPPAPRDWSWRLDPNAELPPC